MGASKRRRAAGRAVRKRRRIGQAWRAYGDSLGMQLLPGQIAFLVALYDAAPGESKRRGKR